MKTLPTLCAAALLSGTFGVMPVLAQTPATPAQTSAGTPNYQGMLKDASTMMGHIGIANIALLHNMTDEAAANVKQALTIARQLEGQTARLNADAIKIGKLTYHSASLDTHDYWLPLENDTFVVSDLDSEYLRSKEPKAAEEDAQSVTTSVTLDVKQVMNALEKADAAIDAKHYGDAQVALFDAAHSTFTAQTIGELPLVTARDNLALAGALAKSKDYDGASFALNHAKAALKEYQRTAEEEKSKQAGTIQTEIGALQADIASHEPSIAGNIETRVKTWLHKIESL